MLLNLLNTLTDPDNIPSGYGGLDMRPIWTLVITIIAIAVILVSAFIIHYLYKISKNEEITNKKWIPHAIIAIAVILTIVLITFCCLAVKK